MSLRWGDYRYEPGLVCEHDDLVPVTEAEFLEDMRDVGLDGRLADVEPADLCVDRPRAMSRRMSCSRAVSSSSSFGGSW